MYSERHYPGTKTRSLQLGSSAITVPSNIQVTIVDVALVDYPGNSTLKRFKYPNGTFSRYFESVKVGMIYLKNALDFKVITDVQFTRLKIELEKCPAYF